MMGGGYNFGAPGQGDGSGMWIVLLLAVAMFGGIAFAAWISQYP